MKDSKLSKYSKYRWHRIAIVIFILSEIIALGFFGLLGGALYYDYNDSVEKTALKSFKEYNDSYQNTENSLNSFFNKYENVGCYKRTTNNISSVSQYSFNEVFCNPDIDYFVDYISNEITSTSNYSQYSITELKTAIQSSNNFKEQIPYCTIIPDNYYSCKLTNLVAYENSQARIELTIAVGIVSGLLGGLVVGFSLYAIYRFGILYVAFGSRKKL